MTQKRKVVVVDDDATNAQMFEEFLVSQGYDVILAGTGRDGFARVTESNPDIVILDLYLPDMKGSDLCARLRSATKHRIPIILCTAYAIPREEVVSGFRSGADDYFIRPFALSELAARMDALIRRPPAELPVAAEPAPPLNILLESLSAPLPKNELPLIWRRILSVLMEPARAFQQIHEKEDLLVGLILVLATPIVNSVTQSLQKDSAFDSWLSSLSLGLLMQLVIWLGIAGMLHMSVPFFGRSWPMKKVLSIAGLTWAPRLLEAVIAVVYTVLARIWVVDPSPFTSGFGLIPGLSKNAAAALNRIGLFDLWSAALLLIAVWSSCQMRKKWNSVTIVLAILCLLFGAFLKL